MTESALLENILDRLGRADSAEEIFGADEVADWPAGALDLLIKAGLLRRAEPAHAIECNGCEQYCFMPVHVLPAEGNRPALVAPFDLGLCQRLKIVRTSGH
jgi:hypothetical protein